MRDWQLQKLAEFLSKRFGLKPCPSCQESKGWTLSALMETYEYKEGLKLGGAKIFPIVSTICKGCCSMQFYSAIDLGVVDGRTGKFLLDKSGSKG